MEVIGSNPLAPTIFSIGCWIRFLLVLRLDWQAHRFGFRRSLELVLRARRRGRSDQGAEAEHDSKSDERSLYSDAALPGGSRDGDALPVGEPAVERVGT